MNITILFTIFFLITVLGSINWGFHVIGYNLVEMFFMSKKDLTTTGKSIYYLFMISALIAIIIFFRQKMYKPAKTSEDIV